MNKEILELVTKIFTFLKLEDYTKLTNILSMIEKEFPDYYKFFEIFKNKSMNEKVSGVLSDVLGTLTLGGTPFALLGKKAEKEEKEKEIISEENSLKDGIKEILKNYSDSSEEKRFLEFLSEKLLYLGGIMRGKNFILTILVFLFISILGFAVENPNSLTPESVMEALNPDFVEGIKEYKPNLENIDKVFNYIEKNIKQKGRAIFYGKLDQEKKELIVTDENNKIIYIEKLPEKFVNSIPYFEVKQTYSLKNGKTLNYSEMNTEMLEKKVKMKSETLMKTKMNKKDAIKILKLAPDLSTSTNNVFSNIEYSKFEVYDTNNNLLQRTYYKNKKMVIEQEIEGDKVKMITYFDNLNTMNGKMEAYVNDTLVSSMQIKNLLPEGESKIFYPSGKILTVTNVKNGTMDGTMKVFYENGKIRMIGHFKDGKKDGEFIEYEEDGTIIDKILYKNDEMVSQ